MSQAEMTWDDQDDFSKWEKYQQKRRASYENKVAKYIWNHLQEDVVPPAPLQKLSMREVDDCLALPMHVVPTLIRNLPSSMSTLVKKFGKTSLFHAYADMVCDLEELVQAGDRELCLVFPWTGVSQYVACYDGEPFGEVGKFRLQIRHKDKLFTVEELIDCLQ